MKYFCYIFASSTKRKTNNLNLKTMSKTVVKPWVKTTGIILVVAVAVAEGAPGKTTGAD